MKKRLIWHALSAAFLMTLGLAPALSPQAAAQTPKADFTLIHSAWMGGWQWGHVGAALSAHGHRFSAPDLPAHGNNKANPADVTLASYVQTIVAALYKTPGRSTLVGHSFGGIVASQVAEARPDKVQAIVYLCAFMLPNGVSFLDATANVTTSEVLNNLVFSADKLTVGINEAALHSAVASDVPAGDFAAAKPNLVAEPTAPLGEKLQLTEAHYGSIPRYYVECTQDNAIPWDIQRSMYAGQPVAQVYTLASSHAPMFSMPQTVADILDDIAAKEAVRNAIEAASEEWKTAFNAGSAAGAAAVYEPDAIMVVKPFGTFKGRAAIQGFWANIIAQGLTNVRYAGTKVEILDRQSGVLSADWQMNKAAGTITKELWVLQNDGRALLREDFFEAYP